MAMQQVETLNMLAYFITPIPRIELHLGSGRVVGPIDIEDAPSHVTEETRNKKVEIPVGTIIPILEDVETPTETPTETHIKNPPVQILRNPP